MQKVWEGERPPVEVPRETALEAAQQFRNGNPIWVFIKAEWKWLFALIFPLLLGGGWLALPASTATVEKARASAASDLAIVKAEVSGQFQVVSTQIGELKAAGAETRADIKELLRRIPAYRQPPETPPAPIAASAPSALPTAANPPRKRTPPKRAEVVKKACAGLLCRW